MTKRRVLGDGPLNVTQEIDITFGAFTVGKFRVPFMSSILRFQQVAEYLNLVTDDPKYAMQNWSISELFQREVSQNRVHDIATNYLNPLNARRPAFFNSITVVLNLKDQETFRPPTESDAYPYNKVFGPIHISYQTQQSDKETYPRNGTYGTIQWNRDEVYAVAIDGQHRLASIKQLDDNQREKSDLSVIFILFEKDLGFHATEEKDKLHWMRSLFIDLNKHAVPVSRTRNLLLDDNDPTARFVRTLFSNSLQYRSTNKKNELGFFIGEDNEFLTCLPLDLIDWHGEKTKINEGPYITSILGLDWILERILKNSNNKYKKIEIYSLNPDDDDEYYCELENVFSSWPESWKENEDDGIHQDYKYAKDNRIPFVLTQEKIELLCNEFNKVWGPTIVRLLITPQPVRNVITERLNSKSISPEFGQWYEAIANKEEHEKSQTHIKEYYASKLKNVEEELRKNNINIAEYRALIKKINEQKKDSIFFLLVGQRALILAYLELVKTNKLSEWAGAIGKDLSDYSDVPYNFYADYLLIPINEYYNKDLKNNVFTKSSKVKRLDEKFTGNISNHFWAGSLLVRDNPLQVDFSFAAAKRGSKLFILMAHVYWFVKVNTYVKAKSIVLKNYKNCFDQINNELTDYILGKELCNAISSMGKNESDRNDKPMSFLGKSLTDFDSEIAIWAGKDRVDHLLKLLKK